jgi:putative methyltransferase
MDSEVEVDEDSKDEVCKACIRCEKGTQEGTMGFFVAAFVRDVEGVGNSAAVSNDTSQDQENEWNGFSDEEHSTTVDGNSRTEVNEATRAEPAASRTSKQPPKKKRKKGRTN